MTRTMTLTTAFVLFASLAYSTSGVGAQTGAPTGDPATCPMHAQHMREHPDENAHHDGVNARGDREMGFSHMKTTHHFRLTTDGGAIEVTANNPADTASRDQIRAHLRVIAKQFSEGQFETPMSVHDLVPPGVPAMERRKADITYTYEQTATGAAVHITTKNPDALDAVHDFLRFQITDHQTGDPLEVSANR